MILSAPFGSDSRFPNLPRARGGGDLKPPDTAAAYVRRPRNTDPSPQYLDSEEILQLIDATPKTPAGARDRAAILTADLTGLRRTELLRLTAGAIEAKAGRVYYSNRTKGGHMRYWHGISPYALPRNV